MAINPLLNSVSATLAQQSSPISVRNSAPVTAAADTQAQTGAASDSSPSASVVQNANLVTASSGLAQLGSLLEVAQSGTEQVGSILQQLVTLASQVAGGSGSGDSSTPDITGGLDSAFQQLLSQVDQTVQNTTFGGTPLLSGVFSGASSADGQSGQLSLPDLSTQGLFGNSPPSVATQQQAQAALPELVAAQNTVNAAGTDIGDVQAQLSFATATVSSAIANNDAASSTLSESDLAEGKVSEDFAAFLSNPAYAAQAQTGNLSENLLSLLQD